MPDSTSQNPIINEAIPGLLLVAIATLMSLGMAACSKSPSERAAEAAISAASGHKVDVDRDGDKVTIKTDEGQMQISAGEGIALPDDFPKDVYLPPGYTVKSAMQLPQAMMVQVVAPGPINELFAQADKAMLAQGWEQTMSMQQAANTRVLAYKKPDRQATVSLHGQDDGQVQVGLQVSKSKRQ